MEATMVWRILALLLYAGGALGSDNRRVMREDLRRKCFSVGTCMPASGPDESKENICRVFGKAVRCMEGALQACRLLRFPAESLAPSEQQIKELRGLIALKCASHSTTTTTTTTTTITTTTTTTNVTWAAAAEHVNTTTTDAPSNATLSSLSSATTYFSNITEGEQEEAVEHRHTKNGANSFRTDAALSTPVVLFFLIKIFSALHTASACGL